jgi:DoxX-like protein
MENVLNPTTSIGAPSPVGAPSSRVVRTSRAGLWIGRVLTGLCVAFLLFDALGKLLLLAPVVAATQKIGFAVGVIRPLGLVLALSTLLHLFPRTQLVGALLVTAYLGGATATMVHAGQPFWFPVAMGAILWIAYALRSPSLRALILSSSHIPQTR